jgi:hypothetical protein
MNDEIDDLLDRYAREWRANLPPAGRLELNVAPVALKDRRRLRTTISSVTVAACLVAIAATLWWPDGGHAPRPSAPDARLATTSCLSDFVSKNPPQPTTPGVSLAVRLTNTGPSACDISAYGPWVELEDGAGKVVADGTFSYLLKLTNEVLTVQPEQTVSLRIRWVYSCSHANDVETLRLFLSRSKDNDPGIEVTLAEPGLAPPPCEPLVVHPEGVDVSAPSLTADGAAPTR